MLKRAAGAIAALIAAVVMAASAGAGAAAADAASFSRELAATARTAGVSEETVHAMAVSLVNVDPEDEYRFPDEAFEDSPRSWSAIVAFIKRHWRQIVDAAKEAGQWSWWKAKQCAIGAQKEIWDRFEGDMSDQEAALAAAMYGCLKGLRG